VADAVVESLILDFLEWLARASETGSSVARENPRPSRFWDSRIFVEISRAAEPLTSGALRRRSPKKRMVAKLNVIMAELQHRKHHRTGESVSLHCLPAFQEHVHEELHGVPRRFNQTASIPFSALD
jgi:hypothetical protein